jgi:hypothetical protein
MYQKVESFIKNIKEEEKELKLFQEGSEKNINLIKNNIKKVQD